MQVERADHRHAGADLLADQREEIAIRVIRCRGERGAVGNNVNAIQRAGAFQPGVDLGRNASK